MLPFFVLEIPFVSFLLPMVCGLFFMWGIDMITATEPKASNGHRFILVTIDYFTKWMEAASYVNVTKNVVIRFIKK